MKAYRKSEEGKKKTREWDQSEQGRACHLAYERSERGRAYAAAWRKSEKGKSYMREWRRSRRKSDPSIRLRDAVACAVRDCIRANNGSKKGGRTFDYLPYTSQELKAHLESLWESWMSWENYGNRPGEWTIDHIRPQSVFHYTSLDDPEFQECWALSNLRPLEFIANIKKGNRVA